MVIAIIQFFHSEARHRKPEALGIPIGEPAWKVDGVWWMDSDYRILCLCTLLQKKKLRDCHTSCRFRAGLDRTVGPDYRFIQGQDASDREMQSTIVHFVYSLSLPSIP